LINPLTGVFFMAKATTADTVTDNDPLRSIADAMRDAVHNASEDASRARERVSAASAGVTQSISRFTYTSSYMVSYGIVYATVFIARSIPQDNPIVEGFIDGGRAAIEALNEAKAVPAEPAEAKP
jgi:hypothetical protein